MCIMRVISFVLHLVTAVHRFQFMFAKNCTPKNANWSEVTVEVILILLTGPKRSLREVSLVTRDPIFAVKVNAVLVSQ